MKVVNRIAYLFKLVLHPAQGVYAGQTLSVIRNDFDVVFAKPSGDLLAIS